MRNFKQWVVALSLMLFASVSFAFTVDTSQATGPVSGHWWNAKEPGWGMAIQQQYETLFVQLYTYRDDGSPIWYIGSCKIADGNVCSVVLYSATGGRPLPYYHEVTTSAAGVMTLTFGSNDNALFMFKIGDGPAWATALEKYIFDNTKP